MKKSLALFSIIALFCSCSNTEMYEKIAGEWKCASWINEVRGIDNCDNNVYFKFNPDKTYQSEISDVKDSGDYKIQNDILYVTPNGKLEFAVKITKLNADSLVFLMNQAGDEEILTLVKN